MCVKKQHEFTLDNDIIALNELIVNKKVLLNNNLTMFQSFD